MLTATAMGYFGDEIEKVVVLAYFMPLIISSGGNSGSQASTLIIQAMALGEVTIADWWRVMRRELLSGLMLGYLLRHYRLFTYSRLEHVQYYLRPALVTGRLYRRLLVGRGGALGFAGGLYAAVAFKETRCRSGHLFRTIRSHAG
jgi:hypothetical protein